MSIIDRAKQLKKEDRDKKEERLNQKRNEETYRKQRIKDLQPIIVEMGKRMEKEGFDVNIIPTQHDADVGLKAVCKKDDFKPTSNDFKSIFIESGEFPYCSYGMDCDGASTTSTFMVSGITITAPLPEKHYEYSIRVNNPTDANYVCEHIESVVVRYLTTYGHLVGVDI